MTVPSPDPRPHPDPRPRPEPKPIDPHETPVEIIELPPDRPSPGMPPGTPKDPPLS